QRAIRLVVSAQLRVSNSQQVGALRVKSALRLQLRQNIDSRRIVTQFEITQGDGILMSLAVGNLIRNRVEHGKRSFEIVRSSVKPPQIEALDSRNIPAEPQFVQCANRLFIFSAFD